MKHTFRKEALLITVHEKAVYYVESYKYLIKSV